MSFTDYTEQETKVENYNKKYKLYLPTRSEYISIEMIHDYEYTNSIAYHMVSRTEEFKKLTEKPFIEKNEEWVLKILELGLDPNINNFPLTSIVNIFEYGKEKFFVESGASHTINDIYNGLYKLIIYYFNKNEIYTKVVQNTNNSSAYIKIQDETPEEILQSPNNYYIPCRLISPLIIVDTSNSRMQRQITHHIPLRSLDEDFLRTLKLSDTIYKYTQILPHYSLPELSFPESTIINLPINLNLKFDELIAYVSKAKQEYDKKSLTIKHPLELIGNQYEKAKKIKSENELPKKVKRKMAIADAFYVYDLYKILKPHFEKKRSELSKIRDQKIKEVKETYKHIKGINDERKTHIKNIKETYKGKIDNYSNGNLENIISDITDLSTHKVERFHKLMKEYIDDKKYRELITGKTFTKKLL